MGHHYVPQKYLEGFADPEIPGMIWMHDKKLCLFKHVSIKTSAEEAKYYSELNESQLSEKIEGPANQVLQKLRSGYGIDKNDRTCLVLYIGTMLMRGPRRRRKAYQILPKIRENVFDNFSSRLNQWAKKTSADPELVSRRFNEFEQVKKKFREKPPGKIEKQIRDPWPYEKMLDKISAMTWRIVCAEGDEFFITSDNPVCFFEESGLGKPQSELTFALASNLMLFASWQGAHHETIFTKATSAKKKEANRRIANGAERFVFCQAPEAWVAHIANKKKPKLNPIHW